MRLTDPIISWDGEDKKRKENKRELVKWMEIVRDKQREIEREREREREMREIRERLERDEIRWERWDRWDEMRWDEIRWNIYLCLPPPPMIVFSYPGVATITWVVPFINKAFNCSSRSFSGGGGGDMERKYCIWWYNMTWCYIIL